MSDDFDAALRAANARVAEMEKALRFYAEKVAGCRKIGADGDAARSDLDKDGGTRARAALTAKEGEG